ncbi:thiol reductant ABC exporter subunit CydD [Alicyclobacillus acidocaldarius]|uniref:ABC transporter, CydDC cysteine exporter (CydDC-E) family, permease/ATP-binding protein CydD n=1 Tax=Alicyclobacillus acidocaldarius (strain Tc-4-1) TaxID=1048834 RepID=F8IEQ7_ALIAT|nr:thiol reductant ABC exporter subunit CydD [Alicyclobacillus acidocaldarius]AEJ43953.1 ABC transporter, CydDC cysteine exporter (CydDC-E) family, permease/ATP-binding protein CydD [Alicyclobacillus acidocaldarius subsp. acidocaldarius Tc-4-1]
MKPVRSVTRHLPVATRQERRMFLLASAASALAGLLVLPQAWYLSRAVSSVFPRAEGAHAWFAALIAFFAVIAARAVLMAAAKWLSQRFASHVKRRIRREMVEQMAALGPVEVRRHPAGAWRTWLTDGIDGMDAYLASYLPQAAASAAVPIAILAFAAVEDRLTAVILAATVPFMVLLLVLVGQAAQKATDRRFEALERLGGHFLDVVRGLWTLKVFGRSRAQVEIIERVADDYRRTTMKVLRLAFLSSLVTELFTMVSIGLVAVSLGIRLLNGRMDFAAALVLLLLAPEYYLPIRTAGAQYHAARDGVAMLEQHREVLETPIPAMPLRDGGRTPLLSPQGVTIEFRHVTVRYPGAAKPALQDVSFRIGPRELVAVVGPSGAGKSTLLAVLLGFIRPESGEVLVGGVPLDEIDLGVFRGHLGLVAQEPTWFHATLRDNVTWKEPRTDEEIREALWMSGLDEVVERLPGGMDTELDGERVQLSGGERQRLALARLVLRRPAVALLDEPTRSLDLATERALERHLIPWLRQRTSIVVAHRLSVALAANRVLVLEGGRLVEEGRPEELLRAHGYFHAMVSRYRGEEVLA